MDKPSNFAAAVSSQQKAISLQVLHPHAAVISFSDAFKFNSTSSVSHWVLRLPFIQRTCSFTFMSLHCFSLHFCPQTKFFLYNRVPFILFVVKLVIWEQKAVSTSLQKDLGMRHGGSQELLSVGGFIRGQPPAGKRHYNSIYNIMFWKEYRENKHHLPVANYCYLH